MKVCLACGYQFPGEGWECPGCGKSPEMYCGHLAFSPNVAETSDGFEADFFPQLAKIEEGHFWFESRNRLLIAALRRYFSQAGSFFEIGCGTGFVLSGIQREFPGLTLWGCDFFCQGLEFAEKRLPGVTLFQMDARRIPFADEFDVVGAFDVLEHIDDDVLVLREMYKAVKSGGGCILTVPQHQRLWSTMDEVACHKRRYSRTELVDKVKGAGFKIRWVSSFITLLLPFMVASRVTYYRTEREKKRDEWAEFRLSPFLNRFFEKICNAEGAILMQGVSLPAGGSLICVGMKE